MQICRRAFSTAEKQKTLKRAYLSEGKFTSGAALANELAQNIVHFNKKENSGLVVVNKPAGVPLKSNDGSLQVGLNDAMPDLAGMLGVSQLRVVKSVQRYASGCVLLASSESAANRIKNCQNRSRHKAYLNETYYALTHGSPRKNEIIETVDVQLEKIGDRKSHLSVNGHMMEPVINRILASRAKLKKSQISRLSVNAKVLSSTSSVSLFRVEPTGTLMNFIAVYCADMLSPILGDHHYSYRARLLSGKMTRVSHQLAPDIATRKMSLPDWMVSKLGLNRGDEICLPLHLHLGRVHLEDFYSRGQHLTIFAQPRDFFLGTADLLGLSIPSELIGEDTEIREYTIVHRKTKKSMTQGVEVINPDPVALYSQKE